MAGTARVRLVELAIVLEDVFDRNIGLGPVTQPCDATCWDIHVRHEILAAPRYPSTHLPRELQRHPSYVLSVNDGCLVRT